MKVLTLLGTRPEIIRLSRIIPAIDQLVEKHIIVHTGQNYSPELSSNIFSDLQLRLPDIFLSARGSFAQQIATILTKLEVILLSERPDRFLVLGDTNSSIGAFVAARLGVPVYHMEAGNRCWDTKVPEEINRHLIDHVSTVHLPYSERSRYNLLHEGIPSNKIFVVGNPIYEVLKYYECDIEASDILTSLAVEPKNFTLVTLHRQENVDNPDRLSTFLSSIVSISSLFNVKSVISVHPRTAKMLKRYSVQIETTNCILHEPFGFIDFSKLLRNALCVLSDSGTVQEECAILNVPNVVLRDTTERPETLEYGSGIITGCDKQSILRAARLSLKKFKGREKTCPIDYQKPNVSQNVVNILLSQI